MHSRILIFDKKFNLCLHCYSKFQKQLKRVLKIGNVFINEDDFIPVIVKAITEIDDTYAKGYHVYKNIWKLTVNEELEAKMNPDNVMDKYVVCVRKKTSIVGDLPLGKNGKFAKTIFYFLRADQDAECHKLQSCHNWQRSKSW